MKSNDEDDFNNDEYTSENYVGEEQEEDEYSINETKQDETINNSVNASDFDFERLLYDIDKTLMGYKKINNKWTRVMFPIATTEFIMMYMNSLRALVNFNFMFSQKTKNEAAFEMLEKLKDITLLAVDSGVKEEHIETVINMYDTINSTFYGIIVDGRGVENIKQVLTAVYKDLSEKRELKQKQNSPINWGYIQQKIKSK
jgi:hypothetical protein